MLIIEVVGSVHDREEQKAKDEKRDFELREVGFAILRFKNWEILYSPNGVYSDIKKWVEERMNEDRGKGDARQSQTKCLSISPYFSQFHRQSGPSHGPGSNVYR